MPTACIQHDRSRIHLKSERLEVWGPNPETGQEQLLRELPIRDLDRLIIFESVQISSAALAALLREGIPVNLISWNGQFLGGFLPPQTAHGLARLRQYRQTQDGPFALQMAGRIVSAKLYNQRRVLQRLAAARPAADAPGNASTGRDKLDASDVGRTSGLPVPACAASAPEAAGITVRPEAGLRSFSPVPSTLAWLDTLFASINRSQSIDELRGHEGAAAARYFQAWASFLPSEFPFERRSTRPPLNPVNACISYAAMMVYNEA
ncbi:MAG TPA: CRISPR-associated endonuclease Cas1, partial [Verrucomicrobiae bacterium]|nr:CRISPR-associated endonuclease Cas1 [Verrucomicrobiae bacterium]